MPKPVSAARATPLVPTAAASEYRGTVHSRAWQRVAILCYLSLCAAYLIHLYYIWRYAVDVPYWDEWLFLREEQLSETIAPSWLFATYNSHYIVPTKLQFWIAYLVDALNYRHLQLVNFFLFGLLLLATGRIATLLCRSLTAAAKISSHEVHAVTALFLLLPLNFFNYENHLWAFQSAFHFFLLFHVLSCYLLFRSEAFAAPDRSPVARLNSRYAELGAVCLIAGMYSLATGIAAAVVSASCFLFYSVLRHCRSARGLGRCIPAFVLVVLVLGVAAHWERQVSAQLSTALSDSGTAASITSETVVARVSGISKFFVELISLGFGYQTISTPLSLCCLALTLAPLAIGLLQRQSLRWLFLSLVGGLLAALASIAVGRAAMPISWAKSYRYSEIGVFILPCLGLAWMSVLRDSPVARRVMVLGVWLLALLGYSNDVQPASYAWFAEHKAGGVECLRQHRLREARSELNCPQLFVEDLATPLELARQKELSFTRALK